MKNECSKSFLISSSTFLQKLTVLVESLHCCNRTITLLEIIFVIMAKSGLPVFSSFNILSMSKWFTISSPLPLLLSLKCLSTFLVWICPPVLLVSPAFPKILFHQEHMFSLHLPALLPWDLQACVSLPHPLKPVPQACYPLNLTDLPLFFHSLLNISKKQSIPFSYFLHRPVVPLTLDELLVALYWHCCLRAVSAS